MARFNRMCAHPMCNTLTKNKYCDQHKPSEQRASSSRRGYDARWRRYRQSFLAANPICVICLGEGRTRLATVVDHIKPHKGRYDLFWDKDNHQSLCKQCHDRKTASEDMESWNTHQGLT